jgi:hypothetical protein
MDRGKLKNDYKCSAIFTFVNRQIGFMTFYKDFSQYFKLNTICTSLNFSKESLAVYNIKLTNYK